MGIFNKLKFEFTKIYYPYKIKKQQLHIKEMYM